MSGETTPFDSDGGEKLINSIIKYVQSGGGPGEGPVDRKSLELSFDPEEIGFNPKVFLEDIKERYKKETIPQILKYSRPVYREVSDTVPLGEENYFPNYLEDIRSFETSAIFVETRDFLEEFAGSGKYLPEAALLLARYLPKEFQFVIKNKPDVLSAQIVTSLKDEEQNLREGEDSEQLDKLRKFFSRLLRLPYDALNDSNRRSIALFLNSDMERIYANNIGLGKPIISEFEEIVDGNCGSNFSKYDVPDDWWDVIKKDNSEFVVNLRSTVFEESRRIFSEEGQEKTMEWISNVGGILKYLEEKDFTKETIGSLRANVCNKFCNTVANNIVNKSKAGDTSVKDILRETGEVAFKLFKTDTFEVSQYNLLFGQIVHGLKKSGISGAEKYTKDKEILEFWVNQLTEEEKGELANSVRQTISRTFHPKNTYYYEKLTPMSGIKLNELLVMLES